MNTRVPIHSPSLAKPATRVESLSRMIRKAWSCEGDATTDPDHGPEDVHHEVPLVGRDRERSRPAIGSGPADAGQACCASRVRRSAQPGIPRQGRTVEVADRVVQRLASARGCAIIAWAQWSRDSWVSVAARDRPERRPQRLGERRELRDRVLQHRDRDLGADREHRAVDPLAGERRDGPGADQHLPFAVDDDPERPRRVLLVGVRARDRARQVDRRRDDVDALLARLRLGQPDGGDLGSVKMTRGTAR